MPALRVHRADDGQEPWSVEGSQFFARMPHEALARLASGPYKLLAAILYHHRPHRGDWIDESDGQLAERIAGHPCRGSIQRWFIDLEAGGWVKRVRRRGTRRIYILFELASAKPATSIDAAPALHACNSGATAAPRILGMDGAPVEHSSQKGKASGLCPSAGGPPAGGPAGRRPEEGPTPPPPAVAEIPSPEPPLADAEKPFWRDILRDKHHIMRRLAWTILAEHDHEWLEASGIGEPRPPRVDGWPGSGAAVGPLGKGPRRPPERCPTAVNLADPGATVKGPTLNET